MDWSLCIICGGGGDLKCPADSLENNGLQLYNNFLHLVEEFSELVALPMKVCYKRDQNPQVLLQNRAKWHKSCHLKFAGTKLLEVKEQREGKKRQHSSCADEQRRSKR